ncbi:hypothetical protein [Aureivirga sp. CE67]|uniref:hypothetical protein n=1 Tax=Aureivirga sp. CE67 TaxID=1788983 RepID=UPI0018CAC534|nr:hypothetical protein [Aureivirga sp. CE67]
MQTQKNYIAGFLLIISIHLGIIILSALLSNLLFFIPYEYIPWFHVYMILIELLIIFKILSIERFLNLNKKDLIKLASMTVILFFISQYKHEYDYSPRWCGNAIISGELDEVFEKREENVFFAQITGNLILAFGLFYYVLKRIKN